MLQTHIDHLCAGRNLDPDAVPNLVDLLASETETPEAKADFLTALADKGETPAEIGAFATELRERATPVPVDETTRNRGLLDVCGTGGDGLNTFNISTTGALLCAAAGVPVAKHGNRAITSKSGSADVLNALGIPTDLAPDAAANALAQHNFAFLFAPHYHPAFKHIVPARQLCAQRGQRTLFNFLGPLLNPARPDAQLIGVPRPDLCEPLGQVLQDLGVRRGMIVCGTAGDRRMDELSTLGETAIAEFYQDKGWAETTMDPLNLPLQPATLQDLAGGDAEANAALTHAVLGGEDRGPKRDAVLLNAGAALFVAGAAGSITEGWDLAGEVIDDGRATAKLKELVG